MRRTSSLLALAAAVGTAVSAAKVVPAVLERRKAVEEQVPPELRNPLLYVPLPFGTKAGRQLIRTGAARSRRPLPESVLKVIRPAGARGRTTVEVHLYEPSGRRRPSGVVLWIHGGGYITGAPDMAEGTGGRVAAELGVLVASVDYRLAPEHPFPIPLEDCYTALKWIHDHADELGIDPAGIAVAGESAGGGLAASLAQLAHDRGEVPICFQLLVYPMIDDRTVLREDHKGTGRLLWTADDNRVGWTSYLGAAPFEIHAPEYAAAARRENLTGLPPAWIGVGDLDLFFAENLDYAERLREAGVDVELRIVPGMPHGIDALALDAPAVKEFNDSKVEALRRALAKD